MIGGGRVVGVLPHRGAELFHRRRGGLDRAGLLLGAVGQVVVALGNLRTGRGHALRVLAHASHGAGQAGLHARERRQQQAGLILTLDHDVRAEVACGHAFGGGNGLRQGACDAACHGPGQQAAQRQREQADRDQHPLRALQGRLQLLLRRLHCLLLVADHGCATRQQLAERRLGLGAEMRVRRSRAGQFDLLHGFPQQSAVGCAHRAQTVEFAAPRSVGLAVDQRLQVLVDTGIGVVNCLVQRDSLLTVLRQQQLQQRYRRALGIAFQVFGQRFALHLFGDDAPHDFFLLVHLQAGKARYNQQQEQHQGKGKRQSRADAGGS